MTHESCARAAEPAAGVLRPHANLRHSATACGLELGTHLYLLTRAAPTNQLAAERERELFRSCQPASLVLSSSFTLSSTMRASVGLAVGRLQVT